VSTDTSTGPLPCGTAPGSAIDPSPFVDPVNNQPYLIWKTNDGGSSLPARLWSQALGPDGMTLVGQPHLLQTQDTLTHPSSPPSRTRRWWSPGGLLPGLFRRIWDSADYGEAAVGCSGPFGPCHGTATGLFVTSYGPVAGPGGGMFLRDAGGGWQLAYAA